MAGTFNQSMSQTKSDFEKIIKPIFENLFTKSSFLSLENVNNPACKWLDTSAGVDLLIKHNEKLFLRTVASRIQRTDKDWKTFTIRLERDNGTMTEYEKKMTAFRHGGVLPTLTYQAYISKDDGKLISLGIAWTVDILDYTKSNEIETRHTGDEQIGQAKFYYIKWADFKKFFTLQTVYPHDDGYLAEWDGKQKFFKVSKGA